MTDILIRNVDDADIELIDARASAQGLSRGEYLRRRIEQDARRSSSTVTIEDLTRFSSLSADLLDDEVMGQAWS